MGEEERKSEGRANTRVRDKVRLWEPQQFRIAGPWHAKVEGWDIKTEGKQGWVKILEEKVLVFLVLDRAFGWLGRTDRSILRW